ncbi:MAG: AAA family ATPase [SAR324 cluster bacterium]|nr:AAA family ATPase [SAR324 cluster bacterium]
MIHIPGYKIQKELYDSSRSLILQAQQNQTHRPVVLKVLKNEFPDSREISQFIREYEHLQKFHHPGIIKVSGLFPWKTSWYMVLEDFGGVSLSQILEQRGAQKQAMKLQEFLVLAIQICDILGIVHQAPIIHKDINPSNILLNPESGVLKLIDFGISTELSQEVIQHSNQKILEGTLAYISPEQTGRMNRALDYRTDLYSLGVTFYQMLTGQLPFVSQDPLEIVHGHIARQPVQVHQLNPAIPTIVSNIVMKLLSKNAEDRYRSTAGVSYDLKRCRELDKNPEFLFELGQGDFSERFQIPQKLYGRETEIETLWQTFGRVCQGNTELVLVAGYSGIGKSSLIQELYKPVAIHRGYFISGKFDQFQRNIPYSAFVSAFRKLIRQLLMESSERLETWKSRLFEALGDNTRVVAEVIPELEWLLGKQPASIPLPPTENHNRFNVVFQNFMKVFCVEEHPLVLVLDDLQWADYASLKLLTQIMNHIPWLMVLGAYRDNEVHSSHPLMTILAEIQKTEVSLHTLSIAPLKMPHILQLLQDTLNIREVLTLQGLAELLMEKTGGNPFFLGEFLKALAHEKLLQFDYLQRCWTWDLDQLQARKMTDNVVELLGSKIQQLPPQTQSLLKWAASLGNEFEVNILAWVAEQSLEDTQHHLRDALTGGFLIQQNDTCHFVHDRIQQAVWSMIPEAEKQQLHLQTGSLLLKWIRSQKPPIPDQEHPCFFDIVNHLNDGSTGKMASTERLDLARLNLQAGQKARVSAAYQGAYQYLSEGVSRVSESLWNEDYPFMFDLHIEALLCAYLSGQFEEVSALLQTALAHARSFIDRAKIQDTCIVALCVQTKFAEATELGLKTLHELGVDLPADASQEQLGGALMALKAQLDSKQAEELLQLPPLHDERVEIIMKIIVSLSTALYFSNLNLYTMGTLKLLELTLAHGNSHYASPGYVSYAIVIGVALDDIEGVIKYSDLSLAIAEKYPHRTSHAHSYFIKYDLLVHWHEHIRICYQQMPVSYQLCLSAGLVDFASYALLQHFQTGFQLGEPLPEMIKLAESSLKTVRSMKQQNAVNLGSIYYQSLLAVQEDAPWSGKLKGKVLDVDEVYEPYQTAKDVTALFFIHFYQLYLNYLFEEFSLAVKEAEQTAVNLMGAGVSHGLPFFYFFEALAYQGNFHKVSQEEQQSYQTKIQTALTKLKRWAQFAPMNYEHKYDLVMAENARLAGKFEEACRGYEKAIQGAHNHGYLNDEALACEIAARFYEAEGLEKFARTYRQEAYYRYQRWGAQAKVYQYQSKYSQWFGKKSKRTQTGISLTQSSSTVSYSPLQALDLDSILKASQTLSGEIILHHLLEKMMNIVIENAGADKGFLLLPKQDQWFIEAEYATDKPTTSILQSIPIEDNLRVSAAMIHYVARTQQQIVLDSAMSSGDFTRDAHILQCQVRSVLCIPLKHSGRLKGILYLENNLITGAFTPEHLEVLQTLSAQAAISIDNAYLYHNLEDKVLERTRQLSEKNQELARKNEQITQDLIMAAGVQTHLFQEFSTPSFLNLAVRYIPHSHVSGDIYKFYSDQDSSFNLFMGDSTGHGVTAALSTIMANILLTQSRNQDPKALMEYLNHELIHHLPDDRFMTAAMLQITPGGFLTIANAGHPSIILFPVNGDTPLFFPPCTLMLGTFDAPIFSISCQTSQLFPGDIGILYTDGITERHNLAGELFGEERLCEFLQSRRGMDMESLLEELLQTVEQFAQGKPPEDDISVVLFQYLGEPK